MRRNSVTSSCLETSRSAHAQRKEQQKQARTKSPNILASCRHADGSPPTTATPQPDLLLAKQEALKIGVIGRVGRLLRADGKFIYRQGVRRVDREENVWPATVKTKKRQKQQMIKLSSLSFSFFFFSRLGALLAFTRSSSTAGGTALTLSEWPNPSWLTAAELFNLTRREKTLLYTDPKHKIKTIYYQWPTIIKP